MIVVMPVWAGPVRYGLDPSYEWGFNLFVDQGIQMGRDTLFTYGPLGFLLFPRPIGMAMPIALGVSALLLLVWIGLMLKYFQDEGATEGARGHLLTTAAVLLAAAVGSLENAFPLGNYLLFITTLCVLLHRKQPLKRYIALAIACTAVAALAKISLVGFCLAQLGGYALYTAVRHKRPWTLMAVTVGVPLLSAALWFALHRNFDGLPNYLQGSFELTRGYATSMALVSSLLPALVLLFFVAFLAIPVVLRDTDATFLYLVSAPLILLQWRYCTARLDYFHFGQMIVFVTLFFALVVPLVYRRRSLKAVGLMAVAIVALQQNASQSGLQGSMSIYETALASLADPGRGFWTLTADYAGLQSRLKAESDRNVVRARLPEEALRIIGRAAVDVYPWEASFVYANHLNWKPRRVLHSYTAYSPWLDHWNATFFASNEAPKFLLWHRWDTIFGRGRLFDSVDERYLLNDEPETIREILSRYKPVGAYGEVVLLERREKESLRQPAPLRTETHTLGAWIPVPPASGGIVRARITLPESGLPLVGSLTGSRFTFVLYQFEDDSVVWHRLITTPARSGLWVSPYMDHYAAPYRTFGGRLVKAIRFFRAVPRHGGPMEELQESTPVQVEWELIQPAK
jgi:hypothetical protein